MPIAFIAIMIVMIAIISWFFFAAIVPRAKEMKKRLNKVQSGNVMLFRKDINNNPQIGIILDLSHKSDRPAMLQSAQSNWLSCRLST